MIAATKSHAFLLLLALSVPACGSGSGGDGDIDAASGVPECVRDDSENASTPLPFPTAPIEGYVCPKQDEDWYQLSVGAGQGLVHVDLGMTADRSPIESTYAIWSTAGGTPVEAVAVPDADDLGHDMDDWHCLDPGEYLLVVRDQGDDAQDVRNPYQLALEVASDPDTMEPNADQGSATTVSAGAAVTGYLACAGDQDWYQINVPNGDVIRARLDMGLTSVQPKVQVFNAALDAVVADDNPAAATEITEIDIFRVLPSGGTYYVVVSAGSDSAGDPATPYTLLLDTITDLDPNEPNGKASIATPVGISSCGAGWSSWSTTGTIASPGDTDWFVLPLSGCAGGVLEADVTFAYGGLSNTDAWTLQSTVQSSVGMVVQHSGSPCGNDESCTTLSKTCNESWDCEALSNICLPQELCAGATVCLDTGFCAANQIERHYIASSASGGTPPPNKALLSAPIRQNGPVYLRVTDFQSNGGDPAAVYSLTVRVRRDPDAYDAGGSPNNYYTPSGYDSVSASQHGDRAAQIPIHDCTNGDCCGSGNWITGAISYENDLDFFRYNHPCPGQDCMVNMHYQVDSGPVDHALFIHRGTSPWFSWPIVGSGMEGAPNSCFYAYQGHSSAYTVLVRAEDLGTWSSDQTYRFCIEKTANGCNAPCKTAMDGTCTD